MYFKENDLIYYMTCSCTGKVHMKNITADAMFTSCFSAIFSHSIQVSLYASAARSLTSLPSTGFAQEHGSNQWH